MEKTCATCGQTKPATEFHKHKAMRDGRSKHCRDCMNAKSRHRTTIGYVPKVRRAKPSPLKGVPKRSLEERLWEKVDKNGPMSEVCGSRCWIFTGSIDGHGYGQIWANNTIRKAYAVTWELANPGKSAPRKADLMSLDHLCRNTKCVNPDHLRLVTDRQNAIENNVGPFARNAAKTHCPKGHAYIPGNFVVLDVPRRRKNGKRAWYLQRTRVCIACRPWFAKSRYRVDNEIAEGRSE